MVQIGLWTIWFKESNNMRYFTSSFNIDKKSGSQYDREFTDAVFRITGTSELDNPVYDFKDFNNLIEDNIVLENKNITGKDRDSCCFKVKMSYKSGEFTEYELYNNLSDVEDNDYKAISYEQDRNGRKRCLNVP